MRGRATRRRLATVGAALLVASLLAAAPAAARGRCGSHPWCDTSLPAGKRASLLVAALTPQERIGLLAGDHGEGITGAAGTHTGAADGVPRLDVPPFFQTDGPIGVRQGKATALPSSMALAATFGSGFAREHGAIVGDEARLKGNDLVYGPTVNILRTPLWGRAFESFGEDPYLAARTAVAWTRGLQGQGVIADVKHFAANNQEGARLAGGAIAGSRFKVDARVDERTLREIYLPAFEAAVREGHAGSVMCAYNKVNGVHACENAFLLREVLRREWGFRGLVLADYGASKHIDSALRAGLDYEPFPFLDLDGGENYTPAAVSAALAAGRIDQGLVDAAVWRTLRTLFAYGFFDRPAYTDDDSRIDRAGHARAARALAERGTVLLRNSGVLPLDARRTRSIAVIGADADRYVNGGGSSNIQPYAFTSVRQGIAERAGAGADVRYDDGADLDRAAALAGRSEVAVVVVSDAASEGIDKPCLALDCGAGPVGGVTLRRDALVERVAAANPRTVVIMETAGPVLTPWRDRVAALLEAWYPGESAGGAVAGVLFGDADPGGRLPATFPRDEADLPTSGSPERYPGVDDVVRYSEGLLVGYRWFDARGIAPAYPFGFGLSYTRFAFGWLRAHPDRRGAGARVRFEVANIGRRAGVAVPQVYVGMPSERGLAEPLRQLKGFASLRLRRGERRRVVLRLGRRAFARWDPAARGWRVTRGCYRISLGRSSREIVDAVTVPIGRARCGWGSRR